MLQWATFPIPWQAARCPLPLSPSQSGISIPHELGVKPPSELGAEVIQSPMSQRSLGTVPQPGASSQHHPGPCGHSGIAHAGNPTTVNPARDGWHPTEPLAQCKLQHMSEPQALAESHWANSFPLRCHEKEELLLRGGILAHPLLTSTSSSLIFHIKGPTLSLPLLTLFPKAEDIFYPAHDSFSDAVPVQILLLVSQDSPSSQIHNKEAKRKSLT